MITTVAQAQVITGVKRSPASPEANETLSLPFTSAEGNSVICRLQVRSSSNLASLPPNRVPNTLVN